MAQRIMIFGRPGSGKSTWALKLHTVTRLPLYHLDKYFYQAHWKERNYQEFLALQQALVDSEARIIDGNCTRSLEMRYQKADLVVYFNYSRLTCYGRVFKRLWDKNKALDDRAQGCNETVNSKLLKYMWGFEDKVSASVACLRQRYPATRFVEINHDDQLRVLEQELI